MLRKLVLGALIALIGALSGILAVTAWERWRGEGDAPVRTVGGPSVPSPPVTVRQPDPLTGNLDDQITVTAPQARDRTPAGDSREQSLRRQQSAVESATAPDTLPALHPQVQAQGMAIVQAIVTRHMDSWIWLDQALEVAHFSFFEDLPDSCTSAYGCYNHRTGEAWLSLDALRIEHDSYSRYEGPSSSDIVLHELAHAYARSTPQGKELLSQFVNHYAGCRSDRDGLSTDRLAEELLADTMAISAMRATEDPSKLSIFNTRSLTEGNYGYFRAGGFDGCLAGSSGPDPTLVDAIYATTFDCDSEHALDVFEANQGPYVLTSPSENEQTILKVCWDVECHAGDGCEGWSETDPRQATANERIQHRTCADGIVGWLGLDRVGWESSCGRSYVPDDVECIVDMDGYEVDSDYAHAIFAGEFSEDGTCVGLWCRDQTGVFAMLDGACRHQS